MQATPDGDGTLLDHSMILYGSGMGNSNLHAHVNIPVLVAGGASGRLKGNRHIVAKEGTPLSNLLVGFLDTAGVPTDKLGDNTGWSTLSSDKPQGRPVNAASSNCVARWDAPCSCSRLLMVAGIAGPPLRTPGWPRLSKNGNRLWYGRFWSKVCVGRWMPATSEGMAALNWAAYMDDLETVKLLIAAGANINTTNRGGGTPLHQACDFSDPALIECIAESWRRSQRRER